MPTQAVYVVDDDETVCEALAALLGSYKLSTRTFGSLTEYLAFQRPDVPACLVLDIELPDMNGLVFQAQYAQEKHPPIVFISGRGDVRSSVRALKLGAADFLIKPLHADELVTAVREAIVRDEFERNQRAERALLETRLARLTPRETEVMRLVVSGMMNKQAAAQLGISEVTLEIHRSRVMRKMQASSLSELVRFSVKLDM